uniref:MMPL domain-containing protein n=1 Tax=Globodera pallida TaxID=36090 RepID=A0A183BJ40_GLOPA
MGIVCFLFLNSMFTVTMASGCVLSICCGILGILSWMHTDLDPITMAAMTISIGFSVDIPAHVSYHYYQAAAQGVDLTPQTKLVNCLSSVAFPALQAALSTCLCVSSLLLVHLHMANVFVRTMVLCVLLCNLHGLVFLPAFLILFDSIVQHVQQRVRTHRNKTKVPEAVVSKAMLQQQQQRNGGGGNGGHYRNGARVGKAPAEQSNVTDRPMLDRFNSVDESEGTEMAPKRSLKSMVNILPSTEEEMADGTDAPQKAAAATAHNGGERKD